MTIEELKDILHKLDSQEICELLSNSQCGKCIFYYEETKECIKTVFVEGTLEELEKEIINKIY